MYSKKMGGIDSGEYIITPPPGYDGSRFGNRSDGRDDAFPPYDKPPQVYSPAKRGTSNMKPQEQKNDKVCAQNNGFEKKSETNGIFPFLKKGIDHEELLLIALLIVLVTEKDVSPEIILMLGLLLCI